MRLSKLKLMNYRCFGAEEQIILIDNLTTFIGNNSAGKTAALAALNCMFPKTAAIGFCKEATSICLRKWLLMKWRTRNFMLKQFSNSKN